MSPRYRSRYRSRARRRRGGIEWGRVAAVLAVLALVGGGLWYFVLGRDAAQDTVAAGCPTEPGKVDIAYGARGNSPMPYLPSEVKSLLTEAADAEKEIVVYRVDGDPSEAIRQRFTSSTRAPLPRRQEVDAFVAAVEGALASIRPVREEAAPLAALTFAARDTAPGDTVVLIDSGLQTVDPLNFLNPGWLLAEPADIVAALSEARAIPDLSGRRVILHGLGDTVDPQQDLDGVRRENLIDIWRAIVAAGNAACVELLDDPPRNQAAVAGALAVTPVPIPQPERPELVSCGEDLMLYNGEVVGFEADQDVFRNRAAAAEFLRPYTELIMAEDRSVHLIGTTARYGPEDGQRALALRRAEAVKGLLVEMGVPAERITTEGAGSYSDYYQPDGGPDGPFDPGVMALNRSVILQMLCAG